jgi:hypothetical protein
VRLATTKRLCKLGWVGRAYLLFSVVYRIRQYAASDGATNATWGPKHPSKPSAIYQRLLLCTRPDVQFVLVPFRRGRWVLSRLIVVPGSPASHAHRLLFLSRWRPKRLQVIILTSPQCLRLPHSLPVCERLSLQHTSATAVGQIASRALLQALCTSTAIDAYADPATSALPF